MPAERETSPGCLTCMSMLSFPASPTRMPCRVLQKQPIIIRRALPPQHMSSCRHINYDIFCSSGTASQGRTIDASSTPHCSVLLSGLRSPLLKLHLSFGHTPPPTHAELQKFSIRWRSARCRPAKGHLVAVFAAPVLLLRLLWLPAMHTGILLDDPDSGVCRQPERQGGGLRTPHPPQLQNNSSTSTQKH